MNEFKERGIRQVESDYFDLLFNNEDFTLVDKQPLDSLHHGWLTYRLILKENSTGKFFATTARYNDDSGWEDIYGVITLHEVFLKKKMVAFYE